MNMHDKKHLQYYLESVTDWLSHMDVLYDEIDDITLSQVCQAMENEHTCVGGFEFHDINTDCAKLWTRTSTK
jgi:hypothetical protein